MIGEKSYKLKWWKKGKNSTRITRFLKTALSLSLYWRLLPLLSCLLLNELFWQLWMHQEPSLRTSFKINHLHLSKMKDGLIADLCLKLYIYVPFQPKSGSTALINDSKMSVIVFILLCALHKLMKYLDVLILTQPVCNWRVKLREEGQVNVNCSFKVISSY